MQHHCCSQAPLLFLCLFSCDNKHEGEHTGCCSPAAFSRKLGALTVRKLSPVLQRPSLSFALLPAAHQLTSRRSALATAPPSLTLRTAREHRQPARRCCGAPRKAPASIFCNLLWHTLSRRSCFNALSQHSAVCCAFLRSVAVTEPVVDMSSSSRQRQRTARVA